MLNLEFQIRFNFTKYKFTFVFRCKTKYNN